MAHTGDAPAAVLLDAGGMFVLPDPERILGAFTRAECSVPREVLADADYRPQQGSARISTSSQLDRGVAGLPPDLCRRVRGTGDRREEAIATSIASSPMRRCGRTGAWQPRGLRALADTGVRLGIVSTPTA